MKRQTRQRSPGGAERLSLKCRAKGGLFGGFIAFLVGVAPLAGCDGVLSGGPGAARDINGKGGINCGNNVCSGKETCVSCPADCGPCVDGANDPVPTLDATADTSAPGVDGGAPVPDATQSDAAVTQPDQAGAKLPITYNLAALSGAKIFVSATGNDATGNGSQTAPYKTLASAISAAKSGDHIILRGGVYPIEQRRIILVNKPVTIMAYPNELPIFDGTKPAPAAVKADGDLRYFGYQPIPAHTGNGLTLQHLPAAAFAGTTPTGLAAARGWRCVTGPSSYATAASPASCPGGSSPRVVTGFYPDQVWVAGKKLVQVADKELVTQGAFYVPRSAATDKNPPMGTLYLHKDDAMDLSKVQVSFSGGTIANLDAKGGNTQGDFLRLYAPGITIAGIRIVGHSPAWDSYAVRVMVQAKGATLRNVEISSSAAVAISLTDAADVTLDHVSLLEPGWLGGSGSPSSFHLLSSRIAQANAHREFARGPISGAIKLTKAYDTRVESSDFIDNVGCGLWFDQSCYKAVVASSRFVNNHGASLFFEISHGLTAVNNLMIAGPESDYNLRLAASSGLEIVNNTIVGGANAAVSVHADGRTKKYDSNNDGAPDRYCAEHALRYGLPDVPPFTVVCINGLNSDLNKKRLGRYGTNNQTHGMNFQPSVDLFVNNIMANSGVAFNDAALSVKGYTHWKYNGSWVDASVVMDSIFHQARVATVEDPAVPATVVDGNIYQVGSEMIARFRAGTKDVNSSTGASFVPQDQRPGASFASSDLPSLKSSMAGAVYGLTVETAGRKGTVGQFVDTSGNPTAALQAIHPTAFPVPVHAAINSSLPAGTRHFGCTTN